MSTPYYPKYYSAYQKSNMLQHMNLENMLIGGNAPRKDYMKGLRIGYGEKMEICVVVFEVKNVVYYKTDANYKTPKNLKI